MQEEFLFDEIVRLGYKCNEKCLFCNFTPINEPGYKEKTFEDVSHEIDMLIKKYGKAEKISLYFSGGEPFLWGEALFEMITYAKQKKIGKVGIQSNATLITGKKALRLKELGVDNILVSLHSHQDEINDQITLHKNSTTLALKGIRNLQEAGVDFTLNHVLNKLNYTQFSDFILFLKTIHITEISLGVVQPHGYAEGNFDRIVVNYDDLYPHLVLGYKTARKHNITLISHYCDIPLCKFEDKMDSDLNYESLLSIRQHGIQDYKKFVDDISNSKLKTKHCKTCEYNNYCFGVWKKYIAGFGEDSIKPKKPYIFFLEIENYQEILKQQSSYEISSKNISFFHGGNDIQNSIVSSVKNEFRVIQYYISGEEFTSEISEYFLQIIKLGVNVINIDISNIHNIDIVLMLKNIHTIDLYSRQHKPYHNVVLCIKNSNKTIEKLLKRNFENITVFI